MGSATAAIRPAIKKFRMDASLLSIAGKRAGKCPHAVHEEEYRSVVLNPPGMTLSAK